MAGIPIDIILGSLPEDLKPKGLEKLPQLITNQGIKIDTLIQPSINKILSTLPTENVCLTPPQTSLILNTRTWSWSATTRIPASGRRWRFRGLFLLSHSRKPIYVQ